MSRYRTSGNMDDQMVMSGDRGFVSMNMRLPAGQLKEGELSSSLNGRLDGYWQGRRGIILRSGALSSSLTPLTLPFHCVDDVGGKVISAASRVGTLVTLTVTAHGLEDTGSGVYIGVEGLGYTTTNPNGMRLVSILNANQITYVISGATGNETYVIAGSNDVVRSVIDDSATGTIYGSCHFSDPSNNLEESVLLASSLVTKRVVIGSYAVSDLKYPNGISIMGSVDMIQAFDRVYLFRQGEAALEWIPQGRIITSGALATNLVTLTVKAHGLTTGDSVTVSGLTYTGTNPNGVRIVTAATVDTITYALTSANETYGVTSAKIVASGFTYVQRGAYTQPQIFSLAMSNVVVSSGVATITLVGNTTITVGDMITIHETDDAHFTDLIGTSYEVLTASSTSITFYIPVADHPGTGHTTETIVISGRLSVNGGFTHMPAPPWAVYFQRRLWCPYWYLPSGAFGSYAYTDLKNRDSIAASDILDGDTYDRIFSQFRITAGTADYTVAMNPFYEDRLLILNRNSLHLVRGTQGSLSDTIVTELTREVGCLARRSVVQYASSIFFLSDYGVYGVEFIDEYNLRGIQEPLSMNIQPVMDRINKTLADKSVGCYFNNRYYLAVPLDSILGANDAVGNNSVLIYNLLNRGWESIDSYGSGNFNVIDFHVAQDGSRNSLFLVNEFGGLHEMDARDEPIDLYSLNSLGIAESSSVNYEMKTRGYTFDSFDRKKFHSIQVDVESGFEESDVNFSFSTEDPDTESFSVGSINSALGDVLGSNEAANLRYRLGNPRGKYGQVTVSINSDGSSPIGRPKILDVTMIATVTNRGTISQV